MPNLVIKPLHDQPDIRDALSELLVETVASGGSVSFMHPLPLETAAEFWRQSLAAAGRGERIVLGAFDGEALIATVTLVLNLPPNQPHRAEIAKMLVQRSARGRGIGDALLTHAEQCARQLGRTLLVLDTASDSAERLYERHGWQRCGRIPGYALFPDGRPCSTTIYFRSLT